MAVTYQKPVDDDVPWEQKLVNYGQNKNAGLDEYKRALGVYNSKKALGDTTGADAANKWAGQVDTAIGGIGSNRSSQANNALDTVGQKVNATPFQFKQTAAPFQYNAQADPSYQAALRQAQQGAQTATNNAMVGLGSRGIGNSSVAVDRANQIQQSAIGNVNDTILPQLMQQAYGRYQDENNNEYRNQLANYQAAQDQIGNLSKYAGTLSDLDQRALDNTYRDNTLAETKKQNNYDAYLKSVMLTNDLGNGPMEDYSKLGSKTGNLSAAGQQQLFDNNFKQQQMEQSAKQFAESQGLDWARLNQQQKQFVAEQTMKQKQLDSQNDPNNLDNQYKQAQINSLTAKTPTASGIDEYDLAMIDSLAVNADTSSPEKIRSFIAGLKSQYGWTTDEAKKVESYLSEQAAAAKANKESSSTSQILKKFNEKAKGLAGSRSGSRG